MTTQLRPSSQVERRHPDVEAGNTAVATYAIDLGGLLGETRCQSPGFFDWPW